MSKGSSGGGAGGVATGFGGRTAVKKASGVRYVKSDRAIRSGDVAVKVSVDKLDKAWDKGQRIPKGGGDQGKAKYEASKREFTSGKKVKMPEISLSKSGRVTVADGRHRIANARDAGKKFIYVTVTRGQAKKVRRELGA